MADTSLSNKRIGLLIWCASNLWQSKLRKILNNYKLSLNEYLILESLYEMKQSVNLITQIKLSSFSGINVSVISICIKLLIKKKLIHRTIDSDNRKKIIMLLPDGNKLFEKIFPIINQEESNLLCKLKNEKINFCNSLRVVLGKKIRIPANRNI